MNNYIGKEIGKFIVLNQKRENNHTYLYYKCKQCGKEKWIRSDYIKKVKCCDSNKTLDLTGQRFGRLVVIQYKYSKNGNKYWLCKCDCGNTKITYTYNLTSGKCKSCGCLFSESNIVNWLSSIKQIQSESLVERYEFKQFKNNKLKKQH